MTTLSTIVQRWTKPLIYMDKISNYKTSQGLRLLKIHFQ